MFAWIIELFFKVKTGKTGLIDHPSPVCSEQSVFIRISKSLIIDIEILTLRIQMLNHFRIEWSFNSGERCSLSLDFPPKMNGLSFTPPTYRLTPVIEV
jgi:hypothetical protein